MHSSLYNHTNKLKMSVCLCVCVSVCVQAIVAKLLGRFGKFFFERVGIAQDSVRKNTNNFQVHPISSNWPISVQFAHISKSKGDREMGLNSLDTL